MKQDLIRRLTTYAKMETQSDASVSTTPSTKGQWELAHLLVDELKEIGMQEVTIDDHGYVMATLPSNTDKDVPTIGFLAHIDTATDFTGTNVNPQVVENYDKLFEAASESRLGSEKFMLDGKHTGTGGGNHITIGGIEPKDLIIAPK